MFANCVTCTGRTIEEYMKHANTSSREIAANPMFVSATKDQAWNMHKTSNHYLPLGLQWLVTAQHAHAAGHPHLGSIDSKAHGKTRRSKLFPMQSWQTSLNWSLSSWKSRRNVFLLAQAFSVSCLIWTNVQQPTIEHVHPIFAWEYWLKAAATIVSPPCKLHSCHPHIKWLSCQS